MVHDIDPLPNTNAEKQNVSPVSVATNKLDPNTKKEEDNAKVVASESEQSSIFYRMFKSCYGSPIPLEESKVVGHEEMKKEEVVANGEKGEEEEGEGEEKEEEQESEESKLKKMEEEAKKNARNEISSNVMQKMVQGWTLLGKACLDW